MSALSLIVAFVVGIATGLVFLARQPSRKIVRRSSSKESDNLDTVDEMVLYGEVTGDDFYRIMGDD
jgi:hypothetical protein